MNKFWRLMSLVFLAFTFVITAYNVNANSTYEPDSFGNWYFNYESQVGNYYDNVDMSDASSLRNSLHETISTNVTKFDYTEAYVALETIDEDPNNTDNILCLLTGRSLAKAKHGDDWNREHIWPKSHGFYSADKSAPWNDLNHLRAAEAYTNSTYHNDRDYGYVLEPKAVDIYGNKYDSNFYEPRDCAKGDIARMIFYMDIRYEGDELSELYDLSIADYDTTVSSVDSTVGEIGLLSVLLEWMRLDPVDDLERQRNDRVYAYQGNRNPFIDHPEYANIIYGADYDTAGYRVHYYPGTADFDYYDLAIYQTGDLVKEPTCVPTGSLGEKFVGWVTDLNSDEIFDFANNRFADDDIYLYAKFDSVDLTAEEHFGLLLPQLSMQLDYKTIKNKDVYSPIIETMEITPLSAGGSMSTGIKKNSQYNFDEYLSYDTNAFTLTYLTRNKSSCYVGNNLIKLYAGGGDGTMLFVEGKADRNIVITDVKYVATIEKSAYPLDETSCELIIAADSKSFTIQNIINETSSNIIAISKIVVSYYSDVITAEYELLDDVSINMRANLGADLVDKLMAVEATEYGFVINDVFYPCEIINNTLTFQIGVSAADFDREYTIKLYYKSANQAFFSTARTTSVIAMAKYYTSFLYDDEVVALHSVILRMIANGYL